MTTWSKADAPIRRKFDVLTSAHVGLYAIPVATTALVLPGSAASSTLLGDIAASAEQGSNGLQQVDTAPSEMDGVTRQNAAMLEEASAATRSLAVEATELARQVARFNLGPGRTAGTAPRTAVT